MAQVNPKKSGVTRFTRLIQGALLGFGAPFGWMLLREILSLSLDHPHYENWLFAYMTVGTIGVLSFFGFVIGRKEQRFAEMSLIDPLTSLYNTRHFHIRFQQSYSFATRQNTKLCLLVADIDHFKQVNDTYGHQAGDVVLQHVAGRLFANARETDTVARVGGEEFAIILAGTDVEGAMVVAERMRQAMEEAPFPLPGKKQISVTVSFGVGSLDNPEANSPEALYRQADTALYAAKRSGRNKVVLYEGGSADNTAE